MKALKTIEHFMRRSFIAFLRFRSRINKNLLVPPFPLPLSENPTIILLRQDKLGDAIISTALISALYTKYPKGHFILLLGSKNKGIAPLLPIPCEVLVYQKKLFSDLRMLTDLRKRKADVLIDLIDNPSSTSSIIATAIAATYTIGIEKENASSYNVIVPLLDRSTFHIARRILELLRPFGIDPEFVQTRPILKPPKQKRIAGRVGLVISAGVPERELTPDAYAEIAKGIIEGGSAEQVLVLADPRQRSLAESMVVKINEPSIILAPLTNSFEEFATQLATCELIVTPDTSAVQLCSAYNIPVVILANPFPPSLHYWTPIGVDYELIAVEPNVKHTSVAEVLYRLKALQKKVIMGSTKHEIC